MPKKASTARAHQKALLKFSPFELKDELIKLRRCERIVHEFLTREMCNRPSPTSILNRA
jgi:hypothetical protein